MLGTQRSLMNSRFMGTITGSVELGLDLRNYLVKSFACRVCRYLSDVPQWRSKLRCDIESPLSPLHVEVCWECDAVRRVIDPQHLVYVDADADLVHLVDVRKLKLGIIIREANGFGISCAAFEASFSEGGKK